MDTAAAAAASERPLAGAPPPAPLPDWYAVYTRARHEKVLARELERRGLAVLLPLYRSFQGSHRRRLVERPLFPSYVFARFHAAARLRVLTAPGAVYLVGDSRGPLSIPSAEIRSVAVLAAAGVAAPCAFWRQGLRVRVVRGPLAGVEGVLEDRRGRSALVVSIGALASSVRAEIPLEDVEPT